MNNPKNIALSGAALMAAGVFLPMCRFPIVGSISFIQEGRSDGVFILLMAIVAGILALSGRTRQVVWPGALSLGGLAISFLHFQYLLSTMRREMRAELEGNPFAGLGELALNSIKMEWGWAVLLISSLMLVHAGRTARLASRNQAPESSDGPTSTSGCSPKTEL